MATRIPIAIGPAALPGRAKPVPSLLAKIQANAEKNAEIQFAEAPNLRKLPRSIILRNLDGRTKIEHSVRIERVTIFPHDRLVVDASTVTASLAVADGPIERTTKKIAAPVNATPARQLIFLRCYIVIFMRAGILTAQPH
jgi:hypothetical protein